MKAKNIAIAECPCPVKGCDLMAQVFKFRARPNELQRRLGGKLYLRCDDHGRVFNDGAEKQQEYILEHGKKWQQQSAAGAGPVAANPENSPAPRVPVKLAPAPAPSPPPPAIRRHLWDL